MLRFVVRSGITIVGVCALALASPTPATPATPAHASAGGVKISASSEGEQARGLSRAEFERKVIALTNKKRADRGRRKLDYNKRLRTAARRHSDKMAAHEVVTHQLLNEADVCRRFVIVGYIWGYCAENVAGGFSTPRQVVLAWWRSDDHRHNMLSRSARHIGVGVAQDDDGDLYWTMDLGKKL